MQNDQSTPQNRDRAVKGLAVVGFVALIVMGVWVAVYTTRYIPNIINGIAGAAVYLGSVFVPAPASPGLTVVPTASTTLSFGGGATSTATAPKKKTTTGNLYGGTQVSIPTQTSVAPYGLPDLSAFIDATGYMASGSYTFVSTSTIPYGSRPEIRFTIKNVGTNISGPWRFSFTIAPASTETYRASNLTCTRTTTSVGDGVTCTSEVQQSLNPGDYIDYTLDLEQFRLGINQTYTIVANSDNTVPESSSANNTATATVTLQNYY